MIPRRALFFWGNAKMSWLRAMTIVTFRKFHPDWKIILHTPSNFETVDGGWNTHEIQDSTEYQGPDYSHLVEHQIDEVRVVDFEPELLKKLGPVQRSDVWRYAELINGGVYLDMDIVFLRPLDSLIDNWERQNIDVGINYEPSWSQFGSIGMLVASDSNRFFGEVWKLALDCVTKDYYQSAGVMMLTHKFHSFDELSALYPADRFCNLPLNLIMPVMWYNAWKLWSPCDRLPGNHFGVHWFAGHPLSQRWNNSIDEDNYEGKSTLMHRALQQALKPAVATTV